MLPLFAQHPDLPALRAACLVCTRCELSRTRRNVVFGAGDPAARLMLIGQGASQTDDRTGLPYSGPAGEYLDKALKAAGLSREQVWITNVTKCLAAKEGKDGRSELRAPRKTELDACRPWLEDELLLIRPAAIVAIGGPAAQSLIDPGFNLTEQRGQWYDGPGGIATLATYQPTYLVRLSQWDRPKAVQGWRDMVADLRLAADRVIDER